MIDLQILVLLISGYLLGSIPTSVWVGKYFYKIDVREHGSGNAGATNTFRVLGKKAGVFVLLVDVFKGTLSVLLASTCSLHSSSELNTYLQIGMGVAALLGHIFPVFAGFRGGKGVATLLGAVIAFQPSAAVLAMLIFLIFLISFRYVSLASMAAGLSYPLIVILYLKTDNNITTAFSILVAVMLIITHKRNIDRLLKNQEKKVNLFSKKVKI